MAWKDQGEARLKLGRVNIKSYSWDLCLSIRSRWCTNRTSAGSLSLVSATLLPIVPFFSFFIRYFLHLHFKCYPKSPLYPPPTLLPYPPTPTSWPWSSPVLGHIKFARPRGLSSQWWLTRPSSATYAARDTICKTQENQEEGRPTCGYFIPP